MLDYYPGQKKLFLTHIYEHIQAEGEISADQVLFEIIQEHAENLEYLCVDAPLKFPKCVTCRLKCPGYERCKEPEIAYMWRLFRKQRRKKPRTRLFTPYTQRAAEAYLGAELDCEVPPLETLGANMAPLAARAHFLSRRLKLRAIEVYPQLSVLRVGLSMKIPKTHLLYYKHLVSGEESRQIILENLVKRDVVFIYQQDFHKLISNIDSFDAFISAFTGFLKYRGQCEKPPKDFPLRDGWIDFPVAHPELF